MPTEWIVGLGIGGHDSATALLRDGELVAMGEQERFSRNKRAYESVQTGRPAVCSLAGSALHEKAAMRHSCSWGLIRLDSGTGKPSSRANSKLHQTTRPGI